MSLYSVFWGMGLIRLLGVRCRTGSLESHARHIPHLAVVRCRTGSLEKRWDLRRDTFDVRCRTGSLETPTSSLTRS